MNEHEQGKEEQPTEGSASKTSIDSVNKHEEGKGRRFLEDLFPRQRPKEEWEHVYVTRNGRRYVDVKELLEDDRVKALIRKAAEIEVESPRPKAQAERRGQDGGER